MKKRYKKISKLKEKKVEELYNYFKDVLEVDLLNKTRKSMTIEFRSLFNTLLTNKYKLKNTNILHFYETKGVEFNHAAVINSLNKFETYCNSSPEIKELYYELYSFANKKRKYKQKLIKIDKRNLTPIQKIVDNLTVSQQEEIKELIELRIKSWEWKSKDNIKIFQGSF